MNQINKRRNKNNKMDPNTMIEKEKKTDKKYKKKYIRCASCSSSLIKKNIKDIAILFNLHDKDKDKENERNKFSPEINVKNSKTIKNNNKDNDIPEPTDNNNIPECTRLCNKNCTKKFSHKSSYNYRNDKNKNNSNKNNNKSRTKNINCSYINKDKNELMKYINNQMKKSSPFFNRINMREMGIELLCNYMEHNRKKKYKEMKLPGCNINDNDFCLLVKSLIDNEIELPILNMSYNKISDNSAKYIFEVIKKKTCLKNIYLYNNNFSKNFIDKIKNYNKDKDVDSIKLYT
jgi:hypothetical protein